MNIRGNARQRGCVLVVGFACLAPTGPLTAQDKPKAEERTIVFQPRTLPWPATFEWLSSTTGWPVIASSQPTKGTFTYFPAPSNQKYTLGEVIDLLNEGLLSQNYVLIRRDKSILLASADQPLDSALVPRVSIADLDKRGNSEIVSVVISLKSLAADEFAPELKKLLSVFGEVVVVSRANQLVVRDVASNLRRAIHLIQEVELRENDRGKSPAAAGILRTYPVPAGQAERLAKLVQEIFKDSPKVRVSAVGTNSIVVFATAEDHIALAQHLEENAARVNTELFQLNTLDAAKVADTLRGMFGDPRSGGPFIDADPIRNSLIVRGSAEQVQEVKSVLRLLGEGANPPGKMRTFLLERGGAGAMAEALHNMLTQMRSNPVKVILPTGPAAGPSRTVGEGRGPEQRAEGREGPGADRHHRRRQPADRDV